MAELISGILLAGGKSESMGRDKKFVEYGGRSLLDISLVKDGLKPAPHLLAAKGNGLKVRILGERELLKFGEPETLFQNINSPEDLGKHKSQL